MRLLPALPVLGDYLLKFFTVPLFKASKMSAIRAYLRL